MSQWGKLLSFAMAIHLGVAPGFARHDAVALGRESIEPGQLREWLTHFSSDFFEGRRTFTEGLGLAAAYIASQLHTWGVQPAGDDGSYIQRVRVLDVKSRNRSTVTVEVGPHVRVFRDGEGLRFPRNIGGRRSFTSDEIVFVGYGVDAPTMDHDDYENTSVDGKVAIWLGRKGPNTLSARYSAMLAARGRYAVDQKGASASIGVSNRSRSDRSRNRADGSSYGSVRREGFGTGAIGRGDFTTVQRLDRRMPPTLTAEDEFFEFLFSGEETSYSVLQEKADQREPLPRFELRNVRITFNLDAEYEVVRTRYTRNVVGVVEGTDTKLRDTYMAFGAHFDHVGYSEGEVVDNPNGPRRVAPRGRVHEGARDDRIWNGADDNGSGCMTILAVARAFSLGPRPRRSLLFVWHSGEERGLLGSRFFADYPTVPLKDIMAHLNMDMVGRNRDDNPGEGNTLYVVGSDRVSTELHNTMIEANAALARPLALDFELNDPSDVEQVYYRSDHYSYAAQGIPVLFLTTGLHSDYHGNLDSAEKIDYEKMARIGRLAYEIGMRVGNLDRPPARDRLGARLGKGDTGKLGTP